jgi:hypothetical protein
VAPATFGGFHVALGSANAAGPANLLGLSLTSATGGADLNYQYDDIVTLTTAQWDAVTGGSGGLTAGLPYYLSDVTVGELSTTKPTTSTHFVNLVGYALSTTELQLQLAPPVLIP